LTERAPIGALHRIGDGVDPLTQLLGGTRLEALLPRRPLDRDTPPLHEGDEAAERGVDEEQTIENGDSVGGEKRGRWIWTSGSTRQDR